MPSALCHLTAEQFSGLLSNPETWLTFLLMAGVPCQESSELRGAVEGGTEHIPHQNFSDVSGVSDDNK